MDHFKKYQTNVIVSGIGFTLLFLSIYKSFELVNTIFHFVGLCFIFLVPEIEAYRNSIKGEINVKSEKKQIKLTSIVLTSIGLGLIIFSLYEVMELQQLLAFAIGLGLISQSIRTINK